MRILSQDGNCDYNYDNHTLIKDYEEIYITTYAGMELIAKYSAEAKARKAMEMLYEAYCGNLYTYIDDFVLMARNYDSRPELLKILNEIVGKVKCFRFPSDDEVEV